MTLEEFFQAHPRVALAFSGGVDSAYLLYAALHHGCDVTAYYVKTEFQPTFEYEDAKRLADGLQANMNTLTLSTLANPRVVENPADRCYHCKTMLFSAIRAAAIADGFTVLLDGTNASDDVADRPGMRALTELQVLSPLRLCGMTKDQIRAASRDAGLFTWNKPAYACLATRIPTGTPITAQALATTETAEGLLAALGFSDFRIRQAGRDARLQVTAAQWPLVCEKREQLFSLLKPYYEHIVVDLEVRP